MATLETPRYAEILQNAGYSEILVSGLPTLHCMAGAGGFEPPYAGIKIQLLLERFQRAFRIYAGIRLVIFQ